MSNAEGDKPQVTLREALNILDDAVGNMLAHFHQLDNSDITTLLTSFALLKENKDKLSSLEETVSKQFQQLSYETIPEVLEAYKMQSVKIAGRNFILSTRVNANISEAQREVGYKWIIEEAKVPELIKPTVNAKQLASFVNSYFETHGKWPPEEAITVHMQNYIQVRKA